MPAVLPVLLGKAPAPVRSNFSGHFAYPFFHFHLFFGFSSHQCTVHHIGFKRTTARCAFYQPFIPLKSRSFVRTCRGDASLRSGS